MLRHVKPPTVEEGPFRLLGTILEANPYLGRIVTGRISSGSIKPNQAVKVLDYDGKLVETGRVTKVLAFRGLERVPVEEAEAGDIVAIAGLPEATVAHTICDPADRDADPRPADRPADAGHDVPRQRFAARRHRRHQGHRPHEFWPAGSDRCPHHLRSHHRGADPRPADRSAPTLAMTFRVNDSPLAGTEGSKVTGRMNKTVRNWGNYRLFPGVNERRYY